MTNEAAERTFGRYLKDLRVGQGCTLQEASARTLISSDMIRAIEEDDFLRLPEPVFVRGFVKTLAESFGGDPADAVDRFHRAERAWVHTRNRLDRRIRRRRWLKDQTKALIGLVVVAVCIVGFVGFLMQEAERQEKADIGIPMPRLEEAPRHKAEAATSHELMVVCNAPTTVKIIVDNRPAEAHNLKDGDSLVLKARERYNVLIADAAAISLALDGRNIPVPGQSGQAVTLFLP